MKVVDRLRSCDDYRTRPFGIWKNVEGESFEEGYVIGQLMIFTAHV